jgi:hypothetical protein
VLILLVVTELVLLLVEFVSTRLFESYAPWLIGLMVLVVVPPVVDWVLTFCACTKLVNIPANKSAAIRFIIIFPFNYTIEPHDNRNTHILFKTLTQN